MMRQTLSTIVAAMLTVPMLAQDGEAAQITAAGPRPATPVTAVDTTGTYGSVILDGAACCPAAGVVLNATAARPFVIARTGTPLDTNSGFSVFNSANQELLRVRSDGVIALGGTLASPWHAVVRPSIESVDTSISFGLDTDLHVTSNAYYDGATWKYRTTDLASNYYLYKGGHHWRVAPSGTTSAALSWTEAMRIAPGGSVGIGTQSPASDTKLHVNGGQVGLKVTTANSAGYGLFVRDTLSTEGYGSGVIVDATGASFMRVSNLQLGYVGEALVSSIGTQPLYLNRHTLQNVVVGHNTLPNGLLVEGTGPSSFGGSVSVAGNLTVTGTVTGASVLGARYQDVAEWVPSDVDLPPATVVVLSSTATNTVRAATTAYDTTVAGVVSEQPGVLLGVGGDSKEMIATTGRVKVRVDATKVPISMGDLLVTSDKPGVAMKSIPIEVGGFAMHRPGTILGKALEPLAAGEGEILVLLSLQ